MAANVEAKVDDIIQRVTAMAAKQDVNKSIYDGNEIPIFSGNIQEYQNFIQRFEILARANRWEEEDKLRRFPLYLKGYALEVYLGLPNNVQNDYTLLIPQFKDNIQTTVGARVFGALLRDRRQGSKETVLKYATNLSKLEKRRTRTWTRCN
jgi:hypothetical protein